MGQFRFRVAALQRVERLRLRQHRISTCARIGFLIQRLLGRFKVSDGLLEVIRSLFGGTGILRRHERLPRIRHFLDWRRRLAADCDHQGC